MSTEGAARLVPRGRRLEIPGRGTTFIRELPGPAGAPTLMLLHGLGATGGLNWLRCFRALAEQSGRGAGRRARGH